MDQTNDTTNDNTNYKNNASQNQPADEPVSESRRRLLRGSALAIAGAGLYGAAPVYGPWKHNHAWAQAGA